LDEGLLLGGEKGVSIDADDKQSGKEEAEDGETQEEMG